MIRTRLLTHDPASDSTVFRTVELPGLDWLALGTQGAATLARDAAAQHEYYELGGCDGPSPYTTTLEQIDTVMQALQAARRDVERMAQHVHDWTNDAYCAICGADGRA